MLYHLEPNDTIVLNNNFVKFVNSLQKSDAASSSWEDVAITEQICKSIVIIVGICIGAYIILAIVKALFERASELRKRQWEERDKAEKQMAELQVKKLDILKELCYDEIEVCEEKKESGFEEVKEDRKISESKKEQKKKEKKLKAKGSDEVETYLNELESWANQILG